jgi:F0F1-type ATP synthase delta subunit
MGALRDLKMSDQTVNFLGVIAENGRTREISSIIGGFDKLMDSHRGVVNATVTHAVC